jgi:Mn2+/Fe2+ NRAMP family transporter
VLGAPSARDFRHKLLAYSGPRYLVALGYMDAGKWASHIAGRRVAVWISPSSTVMGVPANR